ncbi:MAG TPA: fibronectin type III domain-containing protein [Steroidobacteraceae bacterium]|nr:fibronectin type III domain-containing protein [Steroidobacteraceae bacterium]
MRKNEICGRGYGWVLAVALLALLAGCKDDDEARAAAYAPPPGSNAPPTTPAPSPAPVPQARAATLEWTVPTTATDGSTLANLAGFRIHYGKSIMALTTVIEIRNPSISSYVIDDLAPGTYYFAVTAFTSNNHESERSNAGLKEVI